MMFWFGFICGIAASAFIWWAFLTRTDEKAAENYQGGEESGPAERGDFI